MTTRLAKEVYICFFNNKGITPMLTSFSTTTSIIRFITTRVTFFAIISMIWVRALIKISQHFFPLICSFFKTKKKKKQNYSRKKGYSFWEIYFSPSHPMLPIFCCKIGDVGCFWAKFQLLQKKIAFFQDPCFLHSYKNWFLHLK